MKPNKRLAAGVAAAMAVAGVAVVGTATSAQAASGGPYTLNGSPQNQAGTASYVNTPSVVLTATQSASSTDVTITAAIDIGPQTTSFAGFAAASYRLDAYVTIDGGPMVQLTGTDPSLNPAVPPSTTSFPSGTTATATVSGLSVAPHSIVLNSLVIDSNGTSSGSGFATQFSGVLGFDAVYNLGSGTAQIIGGAGVSNTAPAVPIGLTESITVVNPPSITIAAAPASNQTIPFVGRDGDTFTITLGTMGTGSATISVCSVGSTALVPAGCVGSIGTVPLTGGAYAGPSPALATAAYQGAPAKLCATNGALSRCSGAFYYLSAPTLTVTSPMSVGTSYTVSGTNWNPGQLVNANLMSGATVGSSLFSGNALTTPSFSVGTWTTSYTPTTGDTSTTAATATQTHGAGTLTATVSPVNVSALSCTANPQCSVIQTLTLTVTPNANGLKLGELDNATNFGSVQTSPNPQSLTSALDTTTVYDARGGSKGWSSVAFIANPFTGAASSSHTIPQNNLAITVTCAPTTDASPATGPAVVAPALNPVLGTTTVGAAFPLSGSIANSVPLCNVADEPTGNGGAWTQAINGTVNIPGFQAADTYSTVMTVVLTANP